ncbi:DUF1800 domain-containing protein [Salipiger sp. IMCC34102]|uniref:DUF1800 domain-containing protein n=1 Tax=Salipiger sp. IMCC34102 TaxID=2510647 RepID=UPI00101CEE21|nr:DUF1800 domain-containing protein [Salipiger sp. IMCC34102]RYH01912.1 DUF1800 domain-containing protein [Salipiger sp. IMCC34102]
MAASAFDPIIAATRFGTGLSPRIALPASVEAMLSQLAGPDVAADALPIAGFQTMRPSMTEWVAASTGARDARGTDREEDAREAFQALKRAIDDTRRRQHLQAIARAVTTEDGLRERLVVFWADHFTVKAKNQSFRHALHPFVEDAIRPHVAGSFADMVVAVTLHPAMLTYLDQSGSVGPNSPVGERSGRGLNENLARELLELHLFGVDAGYDQRDVTELAELLTGLRYDRRHGFSYSPRWAEPGAERVMRRRYSDKADLSTVTTALRDLASRPAVSRHIARKLAVHFVAEDPSPGLIDAISLAFRESGGDLLATTHALLSHPGAWTPARQKVRRPDLFIASAFRALGLQAEDVLAIDRKSYQRWIIQPMTIMGQPFQNPTGPDGWSEAPADWITPQGLAGRITWALGAPDALMGDLPDPRAFVATALGPSPAQNVVFAANAAETRADGIGVVLSSPAFQRI